MFAYEYTGCHVLVAVMAEAAQATSPDTGSAHFIRSATNAAVDQSGNLIVNFKEAGLSNGSIETITLGGTGAATSASTAVASILAPPTRIR